MPGAAGRRVLDPPLPAVRQGVAGAPAPNRSPRRPIPDRGRAQGDPAARAGGRTLFPIRDETVPAAGAGSATRTRLGAAATSPPVEGPELLPGTVSHVKGAGPKGWGAEVPTLLARIR